ncbi:hypothetical protein [Flavobacterium sp. 1355]|uniref:hypothetical protein n=1 Tax=Flavobacterium sp. 1355 TaxID=2806571 RepID=UPI001AE834C1|nr:hypothetical protein [Flavobacterium sp. 1355]MBP1222674.1 hypothetical protein [Flavobacterium sp. 1355]
MSLNLNLFDEEHVYNLYELYKHSVEELQTNKLLTQVQSIKLQTFKKRMAEIEDHASTKRNEGNRWTTTTLLKQWGLNPTLVLVFYPGSNSYKKYGQTVVANIEYNATDVKQMFESMENKLPATPGLIKCKFMPDFDEHEMLDTADIFGTRLVQER